MDTLETQIDSNDPQFQANAAHHRALAAEMPIAA